jgi:RNA polymerase sigma factor (TIGR02999 family)
MGEPPATGDPRPDGGLWGEIYAELRRLAAVLLADERRDHTLSATALVHEAWLRLGTAPEAADRSRTEFYALASNVMRCVLVDHARMRRRVKRGGGVLRCELDLDQVEGQSTAPADVLALDEALRALDLVSPRHAKIVELRAFAGLSADEIADVLGMSRRTVHYGLRSARAFLRARLDRVEAEEETA